MIGAVKMGTMLKTKSEGYAQQLKLLLDVYGIPYESRYIEGYIFLIYATHDMVDMFFRSDSELKVFLYEDGDMNGEEFG